MIFEVDPFKYVIAIVFLWLYGICGMCTILVKR